jgi:hypothetical protein
MRDIAICLSVFSIGILRNDPFHSPVSDQSDALKRHNWIPIRSSVGLVPILTFIPTANSTEFPIRWEIGTPEGFSVGTNIGQTHFIFHLRKRLCRSSETASHRHSAIRQTTSSVQKSQQTLGSNLFPRTSIPSHSSSTTIEFNPAVIKRKLMA